MKNELIAKSYDVKLSSISGCNGNIEQILTQKVWKSNEVRTQLGNNTTQYYLRGGGSNTVNYDSDSLKFNSNNTGTYYYLGSQYSTTWNFTDALKTKLTLVVNFGSQTTLYWENVNICNSTYLRYTQYTTTGTTYMSSILRITN